MFEYHCHCEHPVKVQQSDGSFRYFRCGHCASCLLSNGKQRSYPLYLEQLSSKYCYFVTLTYDNEHIPLLEPHYITDYEHDTYVTVLTDRFTGKEVYRVDSASDPVMSASIQKVLRKSTVWNTITYAPFSDIQNFKKRFSKNFQKYTHEKIRYYVVSEHGPRTFRAHWHCLLFGKTPEFVRHFREVLYKSWQNGTVRYRFASDQHTVKYTVEYLNSFLALPDILKIPQIADKSSHSLHLGENYKGVDPTKILFQGLSYFNQRTFALGSSNKPLHLWSTLENKVFPKCVGYACKSHRQRLFSYRVYRTAQEIFGRSWRVCDLAQFIVSSSRGSNLLTDYFYEKYSPPDFLKVIHVDGNVDETLPFQPAHVVYETDRVVFDSKEYNLFYGRVLRYLYISKAFLALGEDMRRTLFFIERYYDEKDYYNLLEQYRRQEKDADLGQLEYTLSSYYDNPESLGCMLFTADNPYRVECTLRSRSMCLDKIKHKEHNDLRGSLDSVYKLSYELKQLENECNVNAAPKEWCAKEWF